MNFFKKNCDENCFKMISQQARELPNEIILGNGVCFKLTNLKAEMNPSSANSTRYPTTIDLDYTSSIGTITVVASDLLVMVGNGAQPVAQIQVMVKEVGKASRYMSDTVSKDNIADNSLIAAIESAFKLATLDYQTAVTTGNYDPIYSGLSSDCEISWATENLMDERKHFLIRDSGVEALESQIAELQSKVVSLRATHDADIEKLEAHLTSTYCVKS